MEWKKAFNSLILEPKHELIYYNITNSKINSTVFDFHFTSQFLIDDITNISYSFSIISLSTSPTDLDSNHPNIQPLRYIHSVKILISLRVEYISESGIKLCNLSSSVGDFIISSYNTSNVKIYPELLCLWISHNKNLCLTSTYVLIESDLSI